MASAASSASMSGSRRKRTRDDDSPGLVAFLWAFSLGVVAISAYGAAHHAGLLAQNAPEIAVWIMLVAASDILAVPVWGVVTLSVSLSFSLAAGFLLPPLAAAVIAFLGTTDVRDFRGERSLARSVYNRAQTAVSVLVASVVFHALHGSLTNWPLVVGIGLVALLMDLVVNLTLVLIPTAIGAGVPINRALKGIYGDDPIEHAGGYACLGLFAVILALAVRDVGIWALLLSFLPLIVARQMFMHRRRLADAARRLYLKDAAFAEALAERVRERKEQRIAVAGELHDEVLPPLFKVHLLGQVLRRDLESGRLLQLDEDLPELLSATALAQEAIRDVVGGLRKSDLGQRGLIGAITDLARDELPRPGPEFNITVNGEIEVDDLCEHLAFQGCREAIRNSIKHAGAGEIGVVVRQEGSESLEIQISDDGGGFEPEAVDGEAHFGLQLIAERIQAVGGSTEVRSAQGAGTIVILRIPTMLD